jgi:hypothetical protein
VDDLSPQAKAQARTCTDSHRFISRQPFAYSLYKMLHVSLPDGAQLGFEVLGAKHLGRTAPIVLIGGMSSLRGDWERLSKSLAQVRPGDALSITILATI